MSDSSRKRVGGGLAIHGWAKFARYTILMFLAAIFVFPFYLIIRGAFSTKKSFASADWQWWPELLRPSNLDHVWDNLSRVFQNKSVNLGSALVNSAIVSIIQTVLTIVIAMMAGYAMARYLNRMAKVLHVMTLVTMMIPAAVTFIPLFMITASLGWIDSYQGLIIPMMFSAMAAYMFESHFLGFPHELEEAALIDGASQWRLFWSVVVPNSKGMIAAVSTIIFIGNWNSFLWPMLVSHELTRTVQVSLSTFMTSQGVDYPSLYTGALIAIIPVLIVFIFLQRYLVIGVERSGMAGD